MSPHINRPVPEAYQYFPLNEPLIGSYITEVKKDIKDNTVPALFRPLEMKGMEFKNRIFVLKLTANIHRLRCVNIVQTGDTRLIGTSYISGCVSSQGLAVFSESLIDQGFATRGAGAICMEATAVVPEGRIAPEDLASYIRGSMPVA
ncbi:hypothetical protein H2248_001115 [Termitomyces sp. 'cryptogamus']|nr:hypothetical protein H2248_001115 [Termitomyces sp. 'cryptogamus']